MKKPRNTLSRVSPSSLTSVVVTGILLAAGSWSGLVWLLSNTLPTVPNRWAMYALLQVALTSTALPFVRLLHQRFASKKGVQLTPAILIRQGVWVGLFGTACVWLRIPRLLSIPVALIVALALVVIEALLLLRDRTRYRPE